VRGQAADDPGERVFGVRERAGGALGLGEQVAPVLVVTVEGPVAERQAVCRSPGTDTAVLVSAAAAIR
jgi:hypothetical protein